MQLAQGGAEALVKLEQGDWQVLYLDRRLPDLDAEELIEIITRRFPDIQVILLDSDTPAARENPKPGRAQVDVEFNSAKRAAVQPLPGMVGESEAMQVVYRAGRLVAPRSTTVLITGPTGTGKELVARGLHRLSPRSESPFIVLNCAAIPSSLLESELFGYVRGAFTGASQNYGGRISAAQGGTLFLDEIGDLPLDLQAKLLRFLDQKEVQRLGSTDVLRVDVRVIAATNADLTGKVREGSFRPDLYYRLASFPISLSPLCHRHADIELLAKHFLARAAAEAAVPVPKLSSEALEVLRNYSWPGNVRELQHAMERALILLEDGLTMGAEQLYFLNDAELGALRIPGRVNIDHSSRGLR